MTDPAVAPDDVIRDADAAMYRAKELGGARFELFDETSRDRATAAARARGRAAPGASSAPSCASTTSRGCRSNGETGLIGFEALVRWEHPERGLIDAARVHRRWPRTPGLIVPIGEWVLEQALRARRRAGASRAPG